MKGTNLHIYQSTFTHESRILRITGTLKDAEFFERICIVARHEDGLNEEEEIDDRREVWRVRTRFVKRYQGLWKLLAMLEWMIRVPWRCRKLRVDCVNCHSLVVLPLCVFLKWRHRCKLVYDTHELETETTNSAGIRKRVAKFVERHLIRFADEVVAVTESIADWYRREYSLDDVAVVRNTPDRPKALVQKSTLLKERLGVSKRSQLFIYQGSLGYGRGVELLLRVFSRQSNDKHIVFVGFGPLVDEVKRYSKQYDRIHFHDPVAPNEIPTITSGADVGVALLENTSLNHYYCLGNKVFEYLQCGLPIIVSDFPEMGRLVSENQCGWRVDVEEEKVAELISRITPLDIAKKAEQAKACRLRHVWENEVPKLLRVYNRLAASA